MAKKDKNMKRMVFTTDKVKEATDNLNDGAILKGYENPWFKGDIGIRKAGLAFKMSSEEKEEYVKCAMDIQYFTEKYCKVKTDDGTTGNIRLRDYQGDILDSFVNNRFNILMASRQIGKCNDLITRVLAYDTSTNTSIEVPLYELYYGYKKNKTIYDKVKYSLYSLLDYIKN